MVEAAPVSHGGFHLGGRVCVYLANEIIRRRAGLVHGECARLEVAVRHRSEIEAAIGTLIDLCAKLSGIQAVVPQFLSFLAEQLQR